MISYLTSNENAVFKFKMNTTTAAAAAWTPTASTMIGLASVFVTNGQEAVAGTFQLRFGNVGGKVIMSGALTASSSLTTLFPVPILSGVYDKEIYFETNTSASDGGWNVTLAGFEYGGN